MTFCFGFVKLLKADDVHVTENNVINKIKMEVILCVHYNGTGSGINVQVTKMIHFLLETYQEAVNSI